MKTLELELDEKEISRIILTLMPKTLIKFLVTKEGLSYLENIGKKISSSIERVLRVKKG